MKGYRNLRAWLQNSNGWQRLWCLLVILTFLILFFGLTIGKVESDLGGGNSRYIGSLLCTYDASYLSCNIWWIILWIVAIAGLYALGLAVAWIVAGFRRKS